MIFSSYVFLLFFCSVIVVFLALQAITRRSLRTLLIKLLLLTASLIFYSYWGFIDFCIVLASLVFNYFAGQSLCQMNGPAKRWLFWSAICFNLGLIGYFKYSAYFLHLFPIPELNLLLPLGISFYTFQQIAYIADCNGGRGRQYKPLDYSIFVLFFPQLVAGPIVSHRTLIPQLVEKTWGRINWHQFALGVALFSVGFFKKVCMADNLSVLSDSGYSSLEQLSIIDAWVTTLSFTFQIYFDFSGYSDMALGAALMLGIRLPINFNSPFQARNIQEGWTRWNMTLGNFFHTYLFKPMGGYGRSVSKQGVALFVTMVMVGVWHGATWLFVLWGVVHGLGLITHRLWRKTNLCFPKLAGVAMTFLFVHLTFVLIRSPTLDQALQMYHAMFSGVTDFVINLWGFSFSTGLDAMSTWISDSPSGFSLLVLFLSFWIVFFCKNSNQILKAKELSVGLLCKALAAMVLGVIFLSGEKEFIYFVF